MHAVSDPHHRPVTIVIVDDHPLVREGLTRVISDEPAFHVVGEADSIQRALALEVEAADVVTLDLSLPDVGGLEGIDALAAHWPDARILVLTVHSDSTHAAACAQRGAAGFLSKNATPDEIRTAVFTVAEGGEHFSPAARASMEEGGIRGVRLSGREHEVLRAIAAGQRITDIATHMGVSVKTASAHKMRLQRKLGATNTAQIVVIARSLGLLT